MTNVPKTLTNSGFKQDSQTLDFWEISKQAVPTPCSMKLNSEDGRWKSGIINLILGHPVWFFVERLSLSNSLPASKTENQDERVFHAPGLFQIGYTVWVFTKK